MKSAKRILTKEEQEEVRIKKEKKREYQRQQYQKRKAAEAVDRKKKMEKEKIEKYNVFMTGHPSITDDTEPDETIFILDLF
jgi:hypothetical protein